MNWDAIAATGSILGSIAVIGTIFYLAMEVRHAVAVSKAATQQAAAQMTIDSFAVTLDSQVLSVASRKATAGEPLSPDELSNYLRWVWMRMRVADNAYYQYRKGLLELDAWLGHSVTVIAHVGPGTVAEPYWERTAVSYSGAFRNEVERILEWARSYEAELGEDYTQEQVGESYLAMVRATPNYRH